MTLTEGGKPMITSGSLTEKFNVLKFYGMLKALDEQYQQSDMDELSFEDRLSLMLDREILERENRRLQIRLKSAKLKQQACFENLDFKHSRGLNKTMMLSLSACQWIRNHHNILIVGSTGTGKTYLACALAHQCCLEGYTAQYIRLPRLFQELTIAKADGRYTKLIDRFAKIDLLVLDDLGLSPLDQEQQRDLLEITDDRHQRKSTIITSQLPIKHWHDSLGEPTIADAILDRLIHNAYKIELKGESLRKEPSEFNKQVDQQQELNP